MINQYTIILGYLGLCLVVAMLGQNRKWGFWGYLWSSILLSPVLGLIFLLASDPKLNPDSGSKASRQTASKNHS